MSHYDTITARATPPGRGGISIVRISGNQVRHLAEQWLGGLPQPRQARYQSFSDSDGSIIDMGLVLYFPAPHSFTGEDVLEIHGHGSPIAVERLLRRISSFNIRLARPGEFSE